MKRLAFQMQLKPGWEGEYQKRHDEIWPELKQLLKATGIHQYSIHLDPASGRLFGLLLVDDPAQMQLLPHHPVMQKWWQYMSDLMDTNPDHSPVSIPLQEVFYLE